MKAMRTHLLILRYTQMKTLLFSQEPAVAVSLLLAAAFPNGKRLRIGCAVAFVALCFFYRDEERYPIDAKDDAVYSPCDGVVMKASDEEVIVFLSPLDLHVQKCPIAHGAISRVVHKCGQFHPAFMLEKTDYNEKMTTTFLNLKTGAAVEVDQVAGQIARRIVVWRREGDEVQLGESYGIIKLGSQCKVRVKDMRARVAIGDRVYAGETILFHYYPSQNNVTP